MAQNDLRRIRTTRHFLRDYGRGKFRTLIRMIAAKSTDQEIAAVFGVRPSRAAEWRLTLEGLATQPYLSARSSHTTVEELFLQG